jgi:hypothetical protein
MAPPVVQEVRKRIASGSPPISQNDNPVRTFRAVTKAGMLPLHRENRFIKE